MDTLVSSSDVVARVFAASRRPSALGITPDRTISLTMGEPDSDTPPISLDAAAAALHSGGAGCAPAFRAGAAEYVSKQTGREITRAQVEVSHGGSAGLAATILAPINSGDRVLIPEPTYSLYADHGANGARCSSLNPRPGRRWTRHGDHRHP